MNILDVIFGFLFATWLAYMYYQPRIDELNYLLETALQQKRDLEEDYTPELDG